MYYLLLSNDIYMSLYKYIELILTLILKLFPHLVDQDNVKNIFMNIFNNLASAFNLAWYYEQWADSRGFAQGHLVHIQIYSRSSFNFSGKYVELYWPNMWMICALRCSSSVTSLIGFQIL